MIGVDIDEAQTWALLMMEEHGLLERGWQMQWDRARTRSGQCRFGTRVISLSRYIAESDDEADFMDTVAHEVAHALVGPSHGHDAVWRATAIQLGGSGARCRASRFDPRAPWHGTCPHGVRFHLYRTPARSYACLCVPGSSTLDRIVWAPAAA